ncbi:MAG TPA: hypothetical protein VHJ20_19415 [Polyangia bacterium]|nr:hypothetical protein [Polyangia bacterium]
MRVRSVWRLGVISLGAALAIGGCWWRVSSTSTATTVACDDGTGNVDCCPAGVSEGSTCDAVDAQCFTRCSNGLRGHLVCDSGGKWVAGLGLFPCSADAGADR